MHVPVTGITCTNRDLGYGLSSLNTEIHGLGRMTGNVLTPFQRSQTHDCTDNWIQYNDDNFKTKKKQWSCIAVVLANCPLQNNLNMQKCTEMRGT